MKKKNRGENNFFTRKVIKDGCRVLELETESLRVMAGFMADSSVGHLGNNFALSVKNILSCKGKLVFCGMGKAGIVAQKVAGTFSSLGHASFFMHAAEAGHGDLGMVHKNDMLFLFSNSGNTSEITSIIPFIKEIGSFTVGITGNRHSYLYKNVNIPLWMGDHEEACGLGLAPTTSTTLMIALGDALAVSVLKQNPLFTEQRFAFNHPGGSLGKKLLRIKNAMRVGNDVVKVGERTPLKEVIMAMTRTRIGSAVIVDKNHKVKGIFSDGDLRRVLEKSDAKPTLTKSIKLSKRFKGINTSDKSSDFLSLPIKQVMTKTPRMLEEDNFVMDALDLMSRKKIGEIPVVSREGKLSGVVCLKDLV